VAFGDNGPRKKSLLVTVGALIFQAVAAVL